MKVINWIQVLLFLVFVTLIGATDDSEESSEGLVNLTPWNWNHVNSFLVFY